MNVRIVFGSLGLLCAIVLVAHTACAAVFERDWKTPGDGLLTYDDINQREWLDIPVSNIENFEIPQLENALLELSPGGLYEGFMLANGDDVLAFAQSASIDTSTREYENNQGATGTLIGLLGITWGDVDGRFASLGYLNEFQFIAGFERRRAATFEVNPFPSGFAGLSLNYSDDRLGRSGSTGLMLYREVVPEPSSGLLSIGVAIVLLLICRYDRD